MPKGLQQPTHPGFVGENVAYDCQRCVSYHAAKYDFPELDPANVPAWNLYLRIQGQQRTGGMGELMGLDIAAIEPAFRLFGIPAADWPLLTEKVLLIDGVVQQDRARRRAAEELAAKQRNHDGPR